MSPFTRDMRPSSASRPSSSPTLTRSVLSQPRSSVREDPQLMPRRPSSRIRAAANGGSSGNVSTVSNQRGTGAAKQTRSIGRLLGVPVAEQAKRLPEVLLGLLLVQGRVDVRHEERIDRGREPLDLA